MQLLIAAGVSRPTSAIFYGYCLLLLLTDPGVYTEVPVEANISIRATDVFRQILVLFITVIVDGLLPPIQLELLSKLAVSQLVRDSDLRIVSVAYNNPNWFSGLSRC